MFLAPISRILSCDSSLSYSEQVPCGGLPRANDSESRGDHLSSPSIALGVKRVFPFQRDPLAPGRRFSHPASCHAGLWALTVPRRSGIPRVGGPLFSPVASRPFRGEARPLFREAAFALKTFRVLVTMIGSIVSVTLSRSPSPVLHPSAQSNQSQSAE